MATRHPGRSRRARTRRRRGGCWPRWLASAAAERGSRAGPLRRRRGRRPGRTSCRLAESGCGAIRCDAPDPKRPVLDGDGSVVRPMAGLRGGVSMRRSRRHPGPGNARRRPNGPHRGRWHRLPLGSARHTSLDPRAPGGGACRCDGGAAGRLRAALRRESRSSAVLDRTSLAPCAGALATPRTVRLEPGVASGGVWRRLARRRRLAVAAGRWHRTRLAQRARPRATDGPVRRTARPARAFSRDRRSRKIGVTAAAPRSPAGSTRWPAQPLRRSRASRR